MSYIAFDLNAMSEAPAVGRAAGISEDQVLGGLLRLWAWCFREKVDHASAGQIRGHFGANCTEALADFGFIEPNGELWRIKGAERYLRIAAGRSKGGQKSKGNLLPGGQKRVEVQPTPSRGGSPGLSRDQAQGAAETKPGLDLGSSASSEQRAANVKKQLPTPPAPDATGWQALVDALVTDFAELRAGAEYDLSPADFGQLKALRKKHPDDEIRARWRRGLQGSFTREVNSIAQLGNGTKWNALATDDRQATKTVGGRVEAPQRDATGFKADEGPLRAVDVSL